MNWNNLEETAKSTVRALHISGICERSNYNNIEVIENVFRNRLIGECYKNSVSKVSNLILRMYTKRQ